MKRPYVQSMTIFDCDAIEVIKRPGECVEFKFGSGDKFTLRAYSWEEGNVALPEVTVTTRHEDPELDRELGGE